MVPFRGLEYRVLLATDGAKTGPISQINETKTQNLNT